MAKVHPHAAYAAFTQGFVHKLPYLCRTTPKRDHLLGLLEEKIHQHFIPALTGHAPSNDTKCRVSLTVMVQMQCSSVGETAQEDLQPVARALYIENDRGMERMVVHVPLN